MPPSTEPIVYVNGAFVRQSEARISVLDHAVLYGDGVFDTVVAWSGAISDSTRMSTASFARCGPLRLPAP